MVFIKTENEIVTTFLKDNIEAPDNNTAISYNFVNFRRCAMSENHSYVESDRERESGHVDTRQANFECEEPDPNLGCDLGVDVQG